jgi:hypothetical protein
MPSELSRKLAAKVAEELFSRTGRHEGEKLGDMIATMTMDPHLTIFRGEMALEFEKVIQGHLDATPMEPVAPVKRGGRSQARAECGGRGGRCSTHGRPMGADLQCDEGRGGPLQLPKPTAQRPRTVKKRAAPKKRSSR